MNHSDSGDMCNKVMESVMLPTRETLLYTEQIVKHYNQPQ